MVSSPPKTIVRAGAFSLSAFSEMTSTTTATGGSWEGGGCKVSVFAEIGFGFYRGLFAYRAGNGPRCAAALCQCRSAAPSSVGNGRRP
jgi:hypothetical protein